MTFRPAIVILILALWAGLACSVPAKDEREHPEGEKHANHTEHARHGADDEQGHDAARDVTEGNGHEREPSIPGEELQFEEEHEQHEEGILNLTPEAVKIAGIRLARAGTGRIGTSIHVPGEVGFDEDRLVHVVPRFAGIAKEIFHRVGDHVDSGDVVAVVEGNESLSRYSIPAPISGWIIEKHVTPGEFVHEENPLFVIADLNRVWVNLAVYPKNADKIGLGRKVVLHAVGSDLRAEGTIEYVTPVLDARTRSMTARIVLPNPGNTWRPGTFVHADVDAGHGEERLLVEKDAVQLLDDEEVLFVPVGENRFRSIPVLVGGSDARFIEILGGLEEGMEYVASGAFELKAEVVTSALGDHAGHGH